VASLSNWEPLNVSKLLVSTSNVVNLMIALPLAVESWSNLLFWVEFIVSFELVYSFNEFNIPIICEEPLTIPEEVINPNSLICADELIKSDGNGWTLPLNVYLTSYDAVNCELPLTISDGLFAILSQVVSTPLPLNTYLVSYDAVNCELPLTISDGLFAILSQVVSVILPLNVYLTSYDAVNCDEP
jgi:hypothetical protein